MFKEYFTNCQSLSDIYIKSRETEGTRNENRVYLIEQVLNKMKKVTENVSGNRTFKIEENEKIKNIVERILYFNQLNQQVKGLKILTPSQMLTRSPISLAELKAGNNSEKLKIEIRQLLYSLCRSKNLTKNVYKSLIDII